MRPTPILIIPASRPKEAAQQLSDMHVVLHFNWLSRVLPQLEERERVSAPRLRWVHSNLRWCKWFLYFLGAEWAVRQPLLKNQLIAPRPPGVPPQGPIDIYSGDAHDPKRPYTRHKGLAANRLYLRDLYVTEPSKHKFSHRHHPHWMQSQQEGANPRQSIYKRRKKEQSYE